MNIVLRGILFLLKVVFYPIFAIFDLIELFTEKKSNIAKMIKAFAIILLLALWSSCALAIMLLASTLETIMLGGTTAALIANGDIDPSSLKTAVTDEGTSSGSSSGSGLVTINGVTYNLDLSTIDPNTTVSMPSGMYQNGTALQRAEILLIVQEICARDEITITPQELLGLWYAEDTGSIPFTGSVLENLWPTENDKYVGPFQHDKAAWVTGTTYKGKAFISSLEDPNLSDDQRVQYAGSCSYTIAGQTRPNIYCFSDAAYSAAYRYSLTYSNSDGNWGFTDKFVTFGKNNSSGSRIEELMRMLSSCAYYNGFYAAQKSYVPALYIDIYNKYGDIDQWSDLASSRTSLNNKLKELMNNTTRITGDFESGHTYYSTYADALVGGSWESTQYAFMVFNGGKYIYEGLTETAIQLGATVTNNTSYSSSELTNMQITVVNWAKQYVGQLYFKDYTGNICECDGWCARFVGSAYVEAGLPYPSRDAQYYPHNNSFKYNSDGTIDYSGIPVGACIVYGGSPEGGVIYGHVALYIGDGKIIEAGAGRGIGIVERTIQTSICANTGLVGWGIMDGFEVATTTSTSKSSSTSTSTAWEKLYSVMKTAYGKPYVYGAYGPNSFDCSGYVWWSFTNAGLISWERTSAQVIYNSHCTKISKSDLKPGDVIFYSSANSTSSIDHIAIYVNSTTISHAGSPVGEASNVSGWTNQPAVAYGRIVDLGN